MTPAHDLPAEGTDQTLELTPKVPLRPANWTNRTSKLTPPQKKKKKKTGKGSWAGLFAHWRSPPQSWRESKCAFSYTPSKLESSGKLLPRQEDQIWQHWLA